MATLNNLTISTAINTNNNSNNPSSVGTPVPSSLPSLPSIPSTVIPTPPTKNFLLNINKFCTLEQKYFQEHPYLRNHSEVLYLIKLNWLKQVLSQFYDNVSLQEVHSILQIHYSQIQKGETENLILDRFPKIPEKLNDFISCKIEQWSIPLFLIFDPSYQHELLEQLQQSPEDSQHTTPSSLPASSNTLESVSDDSDTEEPASPREVENYRTPFYSRRRRTKKVELANRFSNFLTVKSNSWESVDIRYFLYDYDYDEEDYNRSLMAPNTVYHFNDELNFDKPVLNLDLEDFINDFVQQTFIDDVVNVIKVHVATRISQDSKTERAIFVSEKQTDNPEDIVMIFAMYTEEHSWEADVAERGRCYVQYLAKSGLQKKKFWPSIPQVMIAAYVRFVELLGFAQVHLWVDPPEQGDDFLFRHVHLNETQKPKPEAFKQLRKWYTKLFDDHGWDRFPYIWNSNLVLPPTFGSIYDADIKQRSDKSLDIISNLKQIVQRLESAKKELNDIFKECTLVVSLDTPTIVHRTDKKNVVIKDISIICQWPDQLAPHVISEVSDLSFSKFENPKVWIESSKKVLDLLYRNQKSTKFQIVENTNLQCKMVAVTAHTAVLYMRHLMLIFGGKVESEQCTNELREFDLKSKTCNVLFKHMNSANNTPQPRYGHTSVIWKDYLYIFGGSDDKDQTRNDMYRYDLRSHTWEKVKYKNEKDVRNVPEPRVYHSAVVPPKSNTCYFFGGTTHLLPSLRSSPLGSNDLYEYSFVRNTWLKIIPENNMYESESSDEEENTSRRYEQDRVFGEGEEEEDDVHYYGDEEDDIPTNRYGQSMVFYNDELYVFGGAIGELGFHNDLFSFNFATKKWKRVDYIGNAPQGRKFHNCQVVNNLMYICGGESANGLLNDLFEYNFETNTFTIIELEGALIPPGLSLASSVMYTNPQAHLVLFGGWKRIIKIVQEEGHSFKEEYFQKSDTIYMCPLNQITSNNTTTTTTTDLKKSNTNLSSNTSPSTTSPHLLT